MTSYDSSRSDSRNRDLISFFVVVIVVLSHMTRLIIGIGMCGLTAIVHMGSVVASKSDVYIP